MDNCILHSTGEENDLKSSKASLQAEGGQMRVKYYVQTCVGGRCGELAYDTNVGVELLNCGAGEDS